MREEGNIYSKGRERKKGEGERGRGGKGEALR